jgi:hypothetical protein
LVKKAQANDRLKDRLSECDNRKEQAKVCFIP